MTDIYENESDRSDGKGKIRILPSEMGKGAVTRRIVLARGKSAL